MKSIKDNRGSTVVTALVAFLFVSVLVAIILSTVAVNFRMRSIDRRTKDEFYYAEKALNDVYAGLGENCAIALGNSYNTVMSKYTSNSGSYQDQVQAYDEFCTEYLKAIYAPVSSGSNGLSLGSGTAEEIVENKLKLISKMNDYIVDKRAKVISIGDIKYYKSDKKTVAETGEDKYPGIKYTIIKNVKIISDMESVDNSGYMSGVTADIVIETPQVDFFTVNEKDLEYAIAANDGIEFNGNAVINGSVYGGSRPTADINKSSAASSYSKYMTDASDYGGILVNGSDVTINGEYVVSGGDIYIKNATGTPGKLNISYSAKNEIWFDNLTVEGDESVVNIAGDLYAQGDLQVEGKKSNVKIDGNYYGYNDGSFESKADRLTDANGRSTANASSKFSSIIVNSKESSVNMTGINTLVLLGKAYINHESNRTTESGTSLEVMTASGSSYAKESKYDDIGESVALRSGQEIFLCPSEFLSGDTNPNIFEDASYEFSVDTATMSGWFGWQYLDNTIPTKTVKLTKNGVNRAYCYLNFKGGNYLEINENQRKYVADVVNGTSTSGCEPTAKTINYRLKHTNKLQHSEILIGNNATNIYASGAVVEYKYKKESESEDTISVKGNTVGFERFKDYGENMNYKYKRLCTYLDPMTSSAFSGATTTGISNADYESNELPFGKLFWENGIREVGLGDSICSKVIDAEGKYTDYIKDCKSTVIVCHGNDDDAFYKGARHDNAIDIAGVLSSYGNPHNVFMIIDGDAYVKDNVEIKGFIYVQGELIVENGATLTVTYDSTLLDKRLEGELVKLKETYQKEKKDNPSAKLQDCYNPKTLIYYLLDYAVPDDGTDLSPKVDDLSVTQIDTKRKYKIDTDTGEVVYDVTSDYTQFMYLENWRKGQ